MAFSRRWTVAAALCAATGLAAAPLASAQPRSQPPPASFQTPSGNVHCALRDGRLRCDVLERAYDAPRGDCPGGWGGALRLSREGAARALCNARPTRDDEAFVLGYGARWARGGFACESDEAGLRCQNRARRGFVASRARLELF